jgi:hypothetical protein
MSFEFNSAYKAAGPQIILINYSDITQAHKKTSVLSQWPVVKLEHSYLKTAAEGQRNTQKLP